MGQPDDHGSDEPDSLPHSADQDRSARGPFGEQSEWKARYEAAVRAARLILYDWDLAQGDIIWGGEIERILGYRREDMGDAQWAFSQIHPEDRPIAEAEAARAFAMRTPGSAQYRVRRRDGEYIYVEDCTEYLPGNGQRSARLIGFVSDVTERRRAEEALRQLNDSLERRIAERTAEAERRAVKIRELAAELSRTEHRERQRLSKLLHDHLQQLLVAARLRVEALREQVESAELKDLTADLEKLLRDSSDAARSLAVELCPPVLQSRGLVAALSWLAEWMQSKHSLQVKVVAEERAEPADEALRMLLFEAARELLFNVVKHAHTNEARLELSMTVSSELELAVEDHGIGMAAERGGAGDEPGGGFGLSSVRQRLELVEGRMEIRAAPGQGTRIRVCVPCATALGSKTRVLLVDDKAGFRRTLAGALRGQPDFEVVGEADEGRAAVELARQTHPHIIVVEANLPGLGGVEMARRILTELPQAHLVGVSEENVQDAVDALFDAGFSAFLAKQTPIDELVATIRTLRSV